MSHEWKFWGFIPASEIPRHTFPRDPSPNMGVPYISSQCVDENSISMSDRLYFDPDAHKEPQKEELVNNRMKKADATRKKYLKRIASKIERGNMPDNVQVYLERAAFVLGRPLSDWPPFTRVSYAPDEFLDLFKIFIVDGGSEHHAVLLMTDPNFPGKQPHAKIFESDKFRHASALYGLTRYKHEKYAFERTFEPIFLVMNSIAPAERYQELLRNPEMRIDPSDLEEIHAGATLYSLKTRGAQPPTSTTTSGEKENLPPPPAILALGVDSRSLLRVATAPAPASTASGTKRSREPQYADEPTPEPEPGDEKSAKKLTGSSGGGISSLFSRS